jgi:tetratricopeptide (TPR) repeat protein
VEAYIGWEGALNKLNKYEEAIAKYQQAIEFNPDSAEIYF